MFHEIRGDVLVAKGDAAGARKEYEAALAAGAAEGEPKLDRAYVELKRDALPGAATAAVSAAPAPAAAPEGGKP